MAMRRRTDVHYVYVGRDWLHMPDPTRIMLKQGRAVKGKIKRGRQDIFFSGRRLANTSRGQQGCAVKGKIRGRQMSLLVCGFLFQVSHNTLD
ncbi:hypothetical protein NDU88_007670 [Pleurodeles waltl]|uniref:Uncharacterized protein n=1 Tax=Pleurodeles waltl TaxID=8319 RepID=A0AAV7ST20_PLEWA|nr:hypothetical protein NDU88_007670 [Pleurodeles waltl]